MRAFERWLMYAAFMTGFEGRSWTLEKRVAGGSFCRVRLDCVLATAEWSTLFPDATVHNLVAASSDHGPILLKWRKNLPSKWARKKIFRYEVMWETHKDFSSSMAQMWQ